MKKIGYRRTLLVTSLATLLIALATPTHAVGEANWPGYLFDARHGSFNAAATAITPANAGTLTRYWQWRPAAPTRQGQPGRTLFASPTVYQGRVYIGAHTGVFYALDLATRTVIWNRFLGFVPNRTCGARGITSTATVAPDPSRGGQLTVYVAAADGYLYALRASDGATVWRAVIGIPSSTQNDYYAWGSPAVQNGSVYMGISAQCDRPLVRGGVRGYRQASGAVIGTYFTVAAGQRGGSVWSSVAVNASNRVFATTGNASGVAGESIVRINGATMAREEEWHIPDNESMFDSDFGASPTLFTATLNGVATPMIGACNKNGRYYALRQQDFAAGPVWQRTLSNPDTTGGVACLPAAIWDGQRLFAAAPGSTVNGTTFPGAIRRLNPATGADIWAVGLDGNFLGSPTLNGSGVIAAGTYDSDGTNSVYLINSSDGQVLRNIGLGSNLVFAQPVFADGYLLIATNGTAGLLVYRP